MIASKKNRRKPVFFATWQLTSTISRDSPGKRMPPRLDERKGLGIGGQRPLCLRKRPCGFRNIPSCHQRIAQADPGTRVVAGQRHRTAPFLDGKQWLPGTHQGIAAQGVAHAREPRQFEPSLVHEHRIRQHAMRRLQQRGVFRATDPR